MPPPTYDQPFDADASVPPDQAQGVWRVYSLSIGDTEAAAAAAEAIVNGFRARWFNGLLPSDDEDRNDMADNLRFQMQSVSLCSSSDEAYDESSDDGPIESIGAVMHARAGIAPATQPAPNTQHALDAEPARSAPPAPPVSPTLTATQQQQEQQGDDQDPPHMQLPVPSSKPDFVSELRARMLKLRNLVLRKHVPSAEELE
ncbi:hypothetical protein EX895_002444 [Sporisorium graminicola]|uniref:Uncharacterized protein n=1 Tax=Sporisorium graminicola TaxID=280036 RepID=A0A4U7KW74_9BASI|nr:hypothetical protein EX895_002444 [Sporisorium graminicola]TKY88456.1 hypothetical protein EX895_002444 [Sporisorium graminicola]